MKFDGIKIPIQETISTTAGTHKVKIFYRQLTNMQDMFNDCVNMTYIDFHIDTSHVTNMCEVFDDCMALIEVDLSGFDTSNVTTMNCMFNNMPALKKLDVSGFNTKKVTDMCGMFYACRSVEGGIQGVEYFNTSNVTDMSYMFCTACIDLNKCKNWNTSKVKTFAYFCSNGGDTPISKGTTNVCVINNDIDLTSWNVSACEDMTEMWSNCWWDAEIEHGSIDISTWNTKSVTSFQAFFSGSCHVDLKAPKHLVQKACTNISEMWCGSVEAFNNLDFTEWDVSNVTNAYRCFWMYHWESTRKVFDLSKWNAAKITNAKQMINYHTQLKNVFLNGSWEAATVTNMFAQCGNTADQILFYDDDYDYSKILAVVPSKWTKVPMSNTIKATYEEHSWGDGIKEYFRQSSSDYSELTDDELISYLNENILDSCYSGNNEQYANYLLTNDGGGLNGAYVTDSEGIYVKVDKVTAPDLITQGNITYSAVPVVNDNHNCKAIYKFNDSLDSSADWWTIQYMFAYNKYLVDVDFSKFGAVFGVGLTMPFVCCLNLKSINLQWHPNFKQFLINLDMLFMYSIQLTDVTIELPELLHNSDINGSKCVSGSTFYGAYLLKNINFVQNGVTKMNDMSHVKLPNLKTLAGFFTGCQIPSMKLPVAPMCTSWNSMFSDCTNLVSVESSQKDATWNLVTDASMAFQNCEKFRKLTLRYPIAVDNGMKFYDTFSGIKFEEGETFEFIHSSLDFGKLMDEFGENVTIIEKYFDPLLNTFATIDHSKCIQCDMCMDVCNSYTYDLLDTGHTMACIGKQNDYPAIFSTCTACQKCVDVCSTGVIEILGVEADKEDDFVGCKCIYEVTDASKETQLFNSTGLGKTSISKITIDDTEVDVCSTYKFNDIGFHEVTFNFDKSSFPLMMLFKDCTELVSFKYNGTGVCSSLESTFSGCTSLETVDMSNMTVADEIDGFSAWWAFKNCSKLSEISLKLGGGRWYTDEMFYNCSSLTSVPAMRVWSATSMFEGCSSLDNVSIYVWCNEEVSSMFKGCSSLKTLDISGRLSDPYSMFEGCSSLVSVDLSNLKLKYCSILSKMFKNCSSLTSVDLSHWVSDLQNIYDTSQMFYGCTSLTDIDVKDWGLASDETVTAAYMFYGCTSLTRIDMFDVSTVKDLTSFTQDSGIKLLWFYSDCNPTILANNFTWANNGKIYYPSEYTKNYQKLFASISGFGWEIIPY
jgi:surface protein